MESRQSAAMQLPFGAALLFLGLNRLSLSLAFVKQSKNLLNSALEQFKYEKNFPQRHKKEKWVVVGSARWVESRTGGWLAKVK